MHNVVKFEDASVFLGVM